ncbi:LamG-like jellyroll fold domain-containing protein [Gordonibacter massiliensis (ex Traore et al. 2017)]|uniref:LamG-like jellyroll fold domain-containing protein n=1 Tax=Gordonibacter massiliensis (ex Traore et al. 2017) TaxID=1841863 RepID=UPI001C8BD787|nr:LamG-like jellyroll fold domain-containing protein [Gordonibacter massiliensis (ex Traore et al. 2017)]MBX9035154.1 twin-arginine translocation signal domain-containing protein [Gordonibacter massiliensis (ex Traore et al. 2017)]
MEPLETAYDKGTFGVTRRTFLKLAAMAGVSVAGGMLVFPDQEANAAFTQPSEPQWPALSGSKVRFTVHSDTHYTGCDVEQKLPHAFDAIYRAVPDCAAHVFDGDSVNTGTASEYAALLAGANASIKKPALFVMGNHEFGVGGTALGGNAVANFSSFLSQLTCEGALQKPGGVAEGRLNVHTTVGGYHVIAASCGHGYWYGDAMYDDDGTTQISRLDWMRREIAAAAADDPTGTKPIFFMTHHPFPDTVWYSPTPFSAGWIGDFGPDGDRNSKAFYNELKAAYPQLVHFSGHTHIPEEDPRSIFQDLDGFTLVQTATFGNNFWMRGGANADGYDENGSAGGHPNSGYDASQCLLVEVDPANGHEVTIRRMDFRRGTYLGRPWTFKVSDKSTWVYTHEAMGAASKPPVLEQGAAVRIAADSVTQTGASFTITADKVKPDVSGLADDVVMAYRIVVVDAQGTEVYNACYMSDYYKAPVNQPAEFTRPLFGAKLAPESAYSLKAYARNPWEKETLVGEVVFTTAGQEVVPATPLLSVDFSTGSAEDASDAPHAVTAFGNPGFELVEDFGKQVAVFDGSSDAFGYDFATEDFAKLATSTTAEILLQFTRKPGSGYTDVFSCGQGGGQWLEYYPDGRLHYYFTDGSTNVSAPVEPGTWTHITATYDGAAIKMYQNGALVGETAASGPIAPPSSSPYRWFIGADVDGSGKPQAFSAAKVAFAKLTHGTVATAEDVAANYLASAPAAIELPAVEEFGSPTAGTACVIAPATATASNGAALEAVPSVTDPAGNPVGLSITSVPEGAQALAAAAAAGASTLYSFVPADEGDYLVTYHAGYSQASLALPVAAAVVDPDPDPDPSPTPDPDPDPTPDPDPAPTPNPGGQGGGTGGTGGSGSSETFPLSSGTSKLAKTGDPLDFGGALVGMAAAAGAAVCVARGFLNGEFRDEDSR